MRGPERDKLEDTDRMESGKGEPGPAILDAGWVKAILRLSQSSTPRVDAAPVLGIPVRVYPRSVHVFEESVIFLGRESGMKYLYVAGNARSLAKGFEGETVTGTSLPDGSGLLRCPLTHSNAAFLREIFGFARPQKIGVQNSIGLGDRLGIANPGHLRAVRQTPFRPVLAQQSIRELDRTERTAEEVLDAASWAVFQEGYHGGFGADADHLKLERDIDRMVRAGYTMITFDPGDHVINEADRLSAVELRHRMRSLPWEVLEDAPEAFLARYRGHSFRLTGGASLEPTGEQVLRALIKYGGAIAHVLRLFRYLSSHYGRDQFEIELSVDETESVTTPFEHFLVVSELKRRGIPLVGLAPRFPGNFEKGIDYRGDLEHFRREYLQHVAVARTLGPYKISFHSGSDKFSVYREVGRIREGTVHIKTAGTSYLEALRTVAAVAPELFREILDFSRQQYEEERRSYHVSADVEAVPPAGECSDADLLGLFGQDDARQVLHVAYGKVLTARNPDGTFRFRTRLLEVLDAHEEDYYANLERHFLRHLAPFLD